MNIVYCQQGKIMFTKIFNSSWCSFVRHSSTRWNFFVLLRTGLVSGYVICRQIIASSEKQYLDLRHSWIPKPQTQALTHCKWLIMTAASHALLLANQLCHKKGYYAEFLIWVMSSSSPRVAVSPKPPTLTCYSLSVTCKGFHWQHFQCLTINLFVRS